MGADPNIDNKSCVSPLISAIRNNRDCDLYFIEELLNNDADITPQFYEKCGYFAREPINEAIFYYGFYGIYFGKKNRDQCGLKIIDLLVKKINDPMLLFMYNNPKDYRSNIIYSCLSNENVIALKHLIVDLKYEIPDEVFISGTVIQKSPETSMSLIDILKSEKYVISDATSQQKARKELLDYLLK